MVTEIGWEGRMRRKALDTWYLTDAGRWDDLIEQVLTAPPPYRADPGHPVYVIHAGDRAVLIGEQDLTGPLADLVTTVLETGGPPLANRRPLRPEQSAPASEATAAGRSRTSGMFSWGQ